MSYILNYIIKMLRCILFFHDFQIKQKNATETSETPTHGRERGCLWGRLRLSLPPLQGANLTFGFFVLSIYGHKNSNVEFKCIRSYFNMVGIIYNPPTMNEYVCMYISAKVWIMMNEYECYARTPFKLDLLKGGR